MKNYDLKKIRNIVFCGSSGSGKTSLAENMLYNMKAITRVGKIEEGNTVMDHDQDEIEKTMSIALGTAFFDYKNHRINIIDTPGYPDFYGEVLGAVTAAETAFVVASATASVFDVGLELAFEAIDKSNASKAVIINRMDNEQADFTKIIELIQENTDYTLAPVMVPVGKESGFSGVVDIVKNKAYINGQAADIPGDIADLVEEYRMKLMEAVAEADDALLEKYFEEGELTDEEIMTGLKSGIISGAVIPVFATSAGKNIGINELTQAVVDYLPSPADKKEITLVKGEETKTVTADADGDLVAYIFKSFADPNIGDVAYVRVLSGTIKSGMDVFIPEKDTKDKIGGIYHLFGKNRKDASDLKAGEIGGLVKLKYGRGLNTLVKPGEEFKFPTPEIPAPIFWQSIKAANQSDEDKIGSALNRLLDEDPTINADFNPETHEQIISCAGEQQVNILVKRLKSRFKVGAELKNPRIPYKETIVGSADVSYKHKKQSGGRGQYGEVYFRIKALPRGEQFKFINSIVGGTIPSKFIPAIEKGVKETMEKGIIAGYDVVDISVDVYFGSYHDVDSSEMAFKIASSQALQKGFAEAKPILLEPIHEVQIIIPNEYMGDVMGDISTRRGKINGMEQVGKKQILTAMLPLAELHEYFPVLKSLTQGRGRFNQKFSHYEKVPNDITQKVIDEYKSSDE